MKNLKHVFNDLIDAAKLFGLCEIEIKKAQDFLEYNEFELAFDILITQMYEYDIEINDDFYTTIHLIAGMLKLSENDYIFMKELIRNDDNLPMPLVKELGYILNSLKQYKKE